MPFAKGKTTRDFRICSNKGFHIRFPNGWTVSVQFGCGNYCENYEMLFDLEKQVSFESDNAEVWCWDKEGNYWPDDPLAYQSVTDVLKIMNEISKKSV